MPETFKALSIRQPWAWAILYAGKRVENRDWEACGYRGPVLLHASKSCTRDEFVGALESIALMREDMGARKIEWPSLVDLPRGAIVGVARIVGADHLPVTGTVEATGYDRKRRRLDWARGYVGWQIAGALGLRLADVTPLEAVPFKGMLGFFAVPSTELPPIYRATWQALAAKGGAR